MTYAIGHFIYGIRISDLGVGSADDVALFDSIVDIMEESEDEFFLQFYSGSGDVSPSAFGINLKVWIDEVNNVSWNKLSTIVNSSLTEQVKVDYQELVKDVVDSPNFPQEFKDYVTKTEPEIFILWGSS